MSQIATSNLWVVGAGNMAKDYTKVLDALGQEFNVIGRGQISADIFKRDTGIPVVSGGVEYALSNFSVPEKAIVCTGVESLAEVTALLIKAGVRDILVEKPGALNSLLLESIEKVSKDTGARVLIAYNRRFYESVRRAIEIIKLDGGLLSCQFEFTEWSHKIAEIVKGPGVKESWMTANSSHVTDLAFFLAGYPDDWQGWSNGSLDWHPASARFCGAGKTSSGVLFSYFADWEAPGRWGAEFMTRRHRLIFRPMEQLHIMKIGSVAIEQVTLDDELDQTYKPGLYLQTKAFLDSDDTHLCTLEQQVRMCRIYEKMAGYEY